MSWIILQLFSNIYTIVFAEMQRSIIFLSQDTDSSTGMLRYVEKYFTNILHRIKHTDDGSRLQETAVSGVLKRQNSPTFTPPDLHPGQCHVYCSPPNLMYFVPHRIFVSVRSPRSVFVLLLYSQTQVDNLRNYFIEQDISFLCVKNWLWYCKG